MNKHKIKLFFSLFFILILFQSNNNFSQCSFTLNFIVYDYTCSSEANFYHYYVIDKNTGVEVSSGFYPYGNMKTISITTPTGYPAIYIHADNNDPLDRFCGEVTDRRTSCVNELNETVCVNMPCTQGDNKEKPRKENN